MTKRIEYRQAEFIAETATSWFHRLHFDGLTQDQEREFETWVNQSEQHANAYNDICALWLEVGAYEDVARRQFAKVLPAEVKCGETLDNGRKGWWKLGRTWTGLAAALALLVILPIVIAPKPDAVGELYDTSRSQTGAITLEDGSVMHLNARSQAVATYGKDERHILLGRGEALFDVVSDKARPFIVKAGPGQVQVLGTRFDVNRLGVQTTVTVLEGRVRISSLESEGGWSVYASAGEQVVYDKAGFQKSVITGALDRFIAWRDGKFVFERKPLGEVIVEFNRFGKIPMVIMDKELEGLLVDGTFDTDDTEGMLRALEWIGRVEVKKSAIPDYRLYRKR